MWIVMRVVSFAVTALVLAGCGSDGEASSGGGTEPSRGTVLVENEELVLELALDDTHVYWVSDQLLHKLSVTGGETVDVGRSEGESLALDTTDAYFAGGIRGTITKLSKDGGSPVTIVTGEKDPTSLAVDATGVYWANWSSYDTAPVADGSIVRSALDGSNVEPLAEGLVYPRGLALDANDVYFVSASDETLYRLSKTGGTPIAIATGLYDPGPPVLDENAVYVRTRNRPDDPSGEDTIVRVDRDSGGTEVIASERYGIGALAIRGGFVYYTRSGGFVSCDRPSGVVRRVPAFGGTSQDVVVEQSDPLRLVVGPSGIYFTNGSASSHACKTLVKAPLP
jgi:hypothetical protein